MKLSSSVELCILDFSLWPIQPAKRC